MARIASRTWAIGDRFVLTIAAYHALGGSSHGACTDVAKVHSKPVPRNGVAVDDVMSKLAGIRDAGDIDTIQAICLLRPR